MRSQIGVYTGLHGTGASTVSVRRPWLSYAFLSTFPVWESWLRCSARVFDHQFTIQMMAIKPSGKVHVMS